MLWDNQAVRVGALFPENFGPLSRDENAQRSSLIRRHRELNLNHLDDLLGWVRQVSRQQIEGDVEPLPRPRLSLVIKHAV